MKKEKVSVKEKLGIEKEFLSKDFGLVAGVDEVGRGPLAGPVVCCAVIMPLEENLLIEGVDDSKKLSAKKREELALEIKKKAVSYCIYEVSPEVIDEINILNAVKLCMVKAVEGLKVKPYALIVDGNDTHLDFSGDDYLKEVKYVIKGDAKSYTVGCASILAKVYRDNLMDNYDSVYPEYGFIKHKGYGTALHIEAIKNHGLTPLHRKSFTKNFVKQDR